MTKKLLLILIIAASFMSCKETPQENVDRLKNEIAMLENMKAIQVRESESTRQRIASLTAEVSRIENAIRKQKEEYRANVHKMEAAEKRHDMKMHPDKYMYVVKLRIHQTTYTLSVGEYIKNQINDAEFEIPVDKHYYNKCRVGQIVNDPSLKMGSLIFDGDFSKYKVKISGKRIVKRF